MNYYFLPGVGIFGGIKVGFQFAEILASLGLKVVVATPGGEAPRWFSSSAPIVDRDLALRHLTPDDVAIFSLPHDHAALRETGARLVFHCQGTDPAIDPIVADPAVIPLACWPQARDYMTSAGRNPIEVGISISDGFYYDGAPKHARRVAYMPRRGLDIAESCMASSSNLEFVPVSGMHEAEVAALMKSASYFLATSEREWFGLPALEAMAAAAVVVTVPTLGGMDYLNSGTNCVVADSADLPAALARTAHPAAAQLRARLRSGATAVASRYRISLQRTLVERALEAELRAAVSWN
ncbi:MAG: glycosyltransferase [Xanthobacteraceae bacterium]|nr:glycosyltransferase [Xanthobacteraceae bacterium]